MTNLVKKSGKIWSFNPANQIGIIITEGNTRYFFHKNSVLSGPEKIELCQSVIFAVNLGRPVAPGRLPCALNIEILDPSATTVEDFLNAAKEGGKGGAL